MTDDYKTLKILKIPVKLEDLNPRITTSIFEFNECWLNFCNNEC